MLQILIADDHLLMRQLILQIIADDFPEVVCEQVSDGEQLVQKATERNWDMAISDISMPVMNGLEALIVLKERVPALPVLIISIHADKRYAIRAIDAGAHGYIPKIFLEQRLVKAIRVILSGQKYLPEEL